MSFNKDTAAERAKRDLADRSGVGVNDIEVSSITEKDFPDMSLGANVPGEMAAQMISSGWSIVLSAGGSRYEYRADKYQIRLVNYKGANYVVES